MILRSKKGFISLFFSQILIATLLFSSLFSCKINDLSSIVLQEETLPSVVSQKLNASGLFPPVNISALALTTHGEAGAKISWNASPGAVSYQLFRAADEGGVAGEWELLVELESCFYEDYLFIDDDSMKSFHYSVKAISSEGTTSSMSKSAVVDIVKGVYNSFVTDLSASDADFSRSFSFVNQTISGNPESSFDQNQGICLTWSAVHSARFYRIYRIVDGQDLSSRVELAHHFYSNPDDLNINWMDSFGALLPMEDTLYRYYVIPFNENGVPGGGSDFLTLNQSDTGFLLPSPQIREASLGLLEGGVRLQWNSYQSSLNSSFSGYYLFRSLTRNDGYGLVSPLIDSTSTSYLDSTAVSESGMRKTYYYKLVSLFSGDLVSLSGEPVRGYAVDPLSVSIPTDHFFQVSRGITPTSRNRYELEIESIVAADRYYIYYSEDEQTVPLLLYSFETSLVPLVDDEISISYDGDFYYLYWEPLEPVDGLFFSLSCSGGGNNFEGALSSAVKGRLLSVPENLTLIINSDGIRSLSWDGILLESDDCFQILKTDEVDGEGFAVNFEVLAGGIDLNHFILPANMDFSSLHYTVQAVSSENGKSAFALSVADPKPLLFSNFTAESAAVDGAVSLAWNIAEGSAEQRCRVYRKLSTSGDEDWILLIETEAGVSGYDDSTALMGSFYQYKIQAVADYDEMILLSCESQPLDGYPLSSPTHCLDNAGVTQISFYWSAVVGADRYKIILKSGDGDNQLQSAEISSPFQHSFIGLTASTSYLVELYSMRVDGQVSSVPLIKNSQTRSLSDPLAVELLSVSDGEFADHIYLNWSSYSGALQYRISSAQRIASSGWPIAVDSTLTEYSIAESFLTGVDSLLLSVEAQLPDGSWSPSSILQRASILGAPLALSVGKGMDGDHIHLTWDRPVGSGLSGYQIEVNLGSGFVLVDSVASGISTYDYFPSNMAAELGLVLIFRVAALDSQAPAAIQMSNEESGWILPPADLSLKGGLDLGAIHLTWPEVENAADYRVFRTSVDPASSSDWTILTGLITVNEGNCFFSDFSPNAEKIYSYKVQSLSQGGEGFLDFSERGDLSAFVPFSPAITVSDFGVPGDESSPGTNGTSIQVDWSDSVAGLPGDGYRYQLSSSINGIVQDPVILAASETLTVIENLLPGTEVALNLKMLLEDERLTGDNPDLTNRKSVSTILNGPLISTVNGAVNGASIQISFEKPSSLESYIDQYIILRTPEYASDDSVWNVAGIVDVQGADNPIVFADDTVPASGVYFYRVVAKNSDGNISDYYRNDEYGCYFMAPVAMASASVRDPLRMDHIRLSWSHRAGADRYDLFSRFKNNQSNSRISFQTDFDPGDPAVESTVSVDFSTWENGESIGAYYFWIQPKIRPDLHGWPSVVTEYGTLQSYDVKGVREISNSEWIAAVHSEMRQVYWNFRIGPNFDSIGSDLDNKWQDLPSGECRFFRRYDSGWGRGLGADENYLYDLFEFNHASESDVLFLNGSILYAYAFASTDKAYNRALTIENSVDPENSIKNEGWITVEGDYPGKLFIHAMALDCWDLGRAVFGVDAASKEQGNYIYDDCISESSWYQNSGATNANQSFLDATGHGCPSENFIDPDPDAPLFNLNISHHENAFKLVRSPDANTGNIPSITTAVDVTFVDSGISRDVSWNGTNILNN